MLFRPVAAAFSDGAARLLGLDRIFTVEIGHECLEATSARSVDGPTPLRLSMSLPFPVVPERGEKGSGVGEPVEGSRP